MSCRSRKKSKLNPLIETKRVTKLSRGVIVPDSSKNNQGDDAMFIQDRDIGVFDGVGGWRNRGVDVAQYSSQLSKGVSECVSTYRVAENRCDTGPTTGANLVKALNFGAASCKSKKLTGSSTACIATLDEKNNQLRCLNLGDSGLAMFRRNSEGTVVMTQKTEAGIHAFNYPHQVQNIEQQYLEQDDPPGETSKDATHYVFRLLPGDVSVMATDGIWDNLFDEDLCKILEESKLFNNNNNNNNTNANTEEVTLEVGVTAEVVEALARVIIAKAQEKSVSKESTPWSQSLYKFECMKAINADIPSCLILEEFGGKPDDMTVIVSYFSKASSSSVLGTADVDAGASVAVMDSTTPTLSSTADLSQLCHSSTLVPVNTAGTLRSSIK